MSSIALTPEWTSLKEKANTMQSVHLRDLVGDSARCSKMTAKHKGIVLDFSRQKIDNSIMDLLCSLADKAELGQKRAAMYEGEKINKTEDRAVLHTALRAPRDAVCMVDGKNVVPEVHAILDQIYNFTAGVRSGQIKGCTNKSIKNVISVGIGGSYLGPEFVHEALRTDKIGEASAKGRTLRFLANVDPVDITRATNGLDPEETLVVIISKTFTTAETMLNGRTLKDWLVSAMSHKVSDPSKIVSSHMVAVSTSSEKCTEFGIAPNNIFGFWDWVGGRYSVCSAVGIVPLSLQYGFEQMRSFLEGANDIDTHFKEAPHLQNIPVLLGLLGVWNSSFLGYSSRAILPYSQALTRFAAHIQQVDMESNGKSVAMDGSPLPFEAGEINFGEPGTNGQHSFYQLLHQGRVVPAEFIGFCKSPSPIHLTGERVSNHDELMSNFFAQPDALAFGKTEAELDKSVPASLRPHKVFSGNRPSFSLLIPELNAFSLGQLLAIYEHRTATQGFIWGLNSFDQWGVELGKVLAKQVREQLTLSRTGSQPISGFNPSTSSLLEHYIAQSGETNN